MFDRASEIPQWVVDASRNVICDVSDSALRVWRYARKDLIGRSALDLLCEEERPKSEKLRRANRWGETGPWKCRRGDGSLVYMTVRWQQVQYEGRWCIFVFVLTWGETLSNMQPVKGVSAFRRKSSAAS